MSIRRPAVSGRFYPGDADHLSSTVERLLGDARAVTGAASTPPPKALIVPHAGYVYSGSTAARGYVTLDRVREQISRVVLLGPAHYVGVSGLALAGADAFATPLGEVAIDHAAEAALAGLPQVVVAEEVHTPEHSLEVQLPFLQTLLTSFSLVPLAVGDAAPEQVAEVLDAVWGGPETLILISSDLSHYLPYAKAQATARETLQRILDLRGPLPEGRACGARPLNGLLATARARRLSPELLAACNSGDTAGDRDRVVGYAAIGLPETQR